MDENHINSVTPKPAPNVANLPVLPPRPSPVVKATAPPLPDRPDLLQNEKENYLVGNNNKMNSPERPNRNKTKGRPEIAIISAQPMGACSTIPPPTGAPNAVQMPPLPSRPPLTNSSVPQLPERPVETPQVINQPPPLPSRPPDTPKLPERPPADRSVDTDRQTGLKECHKNGPPPRPKSSPVSNAEDSEHSKAPSLPMRDLPPLETADVRTNETQQDPRAPPRRPKRGPTISKAPSKPPESKLPKALEEANTPENTSQTKEVKTDKDASPQFTSNVSKPHPTETTEKRQPPQRPFKSPTENNGIDKDEKTLSTSEQDKEMSRQVEEKAVQPHEPIFAPFETGRVRGLVLKKLSKEIATLQEHHNKPIYPSETQEEINDDVQPLKEKEQPSLKPKPRPTIISAKPPDTQKPRMEETIGRESKEHQESQASLETDSLLKSRPTEVSGPSKVTEKTTTGSSTKEGDGLEADTKLSNSGKVEAESVAPIKPKPKPTIIVAKVPKPSKEGNAVVVKPTQEIKDLETASSKTLSTEKQEDMSKEAPKSRPKPTIIKAVKPPEKVKVNEQNTEEKKEERKPSETGNKPSDLLNSPPQQRSKPKATIIHAAKPPAEKKIPPPRPVRVPPVKNKPDKEKPQMQPKHENLTRNVSRKKKPHLPFSTFYVDIEEMSEDTSNVPKLDDETQKKVPQKRPPPSRPDQSTDTTLKTQGKAPFSIQSEKKVEDTPNVKDPKSETLPISFEVSNNIDKSQKKLRPPRPYSVAVGEVDLQANTKQIPKERKKTKPRPPRPRSLCDDVNTTELKMEAVDTESNSASSTRKNMQNVDTGVGNDEGAVRNSVEEQVETTEREKPKPKPNRPAPVGPAKKRTKRPAPSPARHEKENPSKDKKETKKPSKETSPKPAPKQISSVCPTKIEPVAIALHDYQPSSADDLSFEAGAEILLLSRIDQQWLYGRCGQEEGIFPQNFVEIIEDLPDEEEPHEQKPKENQEENSDLSKVKALYDFHGKVSEGELSFNEGNIIDVVASINDEWLKGTFGGQTGIFPRTFVDCSKLQISSPKSINKISNPTKTKEPIEVKRTSDKISGPRCKALFDYHVESQDDLGFDVGDIIRLVERVNEEWLKGEIGGRTGIFPQAFVEIIEDIAVPQQVKEEKVLWQAVALHDFISETPGDLGFTVGAKIAVTEIVSKEWLKGNLDGKEGIFPIAFVEKLEKEDKPKLTSPSDNKDEIKPLRKSAQVLDEFTPKAKALYDFQGETADEISFKAGDVICLLNRINEDWLNGEINSNVGRFPAAFVEIITPLP